MSTETDTTRHGRPLSIPSRAALIRVLGGSKANFTVSDVLASDDSPVRSANAVRHNLRALQATGAVEEIGTRKLTGPNGEPRRGHPEALFAIRFSDAQEAARAAWEAAQADESDEG